MPNIVDYVIWRGDLTFEKCPFNEIDNLIFSQLSYVDFAGIVSEDADKTITLREASKLFWEGKDNASVLKDYPINGKRAIFMRQAAKSARFGDILLSGYVDLVDVNTETQMSAVQFRLPDDTVYVAFRGTDATIVGWKEDFNLSYMTQTAGQRSAVDYMKRYFDRTSLRLRVGGHSKGGNFAVYASAFSGAKVQKQIEVIYSNDGPGFRQEVVEKPQFQQIIERTVSIVPEDTIIGALLNPIKAKFVVKSSEDGLMQHDAFTWQVLGPRFETTTRSKESLFVEKTVAGWLDEVDDESREMFVDQIFAFIQASGAKKLVDLKSFKEISSILRAARDLPKEDQEQFKDVLTQLVKSGGRTLEDSLREAWETRQGNRESKKKSANTSAKEGSHERAMG